MNFPWLSGRPSLRRVFAIAVLAVVVAAVPHDAEARRGTRTLAALRIDTATSGLAVDFQLSGAPSGTTFEWILTDGAGTPANTKPVTPTTTTDPSLKNVTFSTPGYYNAQVLFTAPGERVVGTATSFYAGPPGAKIPPTARMSASNILPEVGDEVLFDLRQSDAGRSPTVTIDFGDGTAATLTRGRGKHTYADAGWYRVTAEVTAATGAHAPVFLDLEVLEPTAMVGDDMLKYATCMVDLRAAAGEWVCHDPGNALNDAHKLPVGVAPNTSGCILDPTMMAADGWRCFTEQALRRCRSYANGHRHLPSYDIRHCQIESQPLKLSFPSHGEFVATIDEDAYLGIDLATTTEAEVLVTPYNPGEPFVPGICDPVIAASKGGTCVSECTNGYYTFSMPPSGPEIIVNGGLPCDSSFFIPLDDGWSSVGDLHEQLAATCPVLVPGAGDPPVDYETSMWTDVTAHFVWQIPRTEEWFDGMTTQTSYSNQPYDVAVETVSISAPLTVTCRR